MTNDYDNLLYVCNRCNAARRLSTVLDPCSHAFWDHLRVDDDGTVGAITTEGRHIINAFNLNYSQAREYRRRKIEALNRWQEARDEWMISNELAYPDDLPQLDSRRCSNSRPEGVWSSYYALQTRGELPPTY